MKPTPKWRDVLPVHPAAELFPPMSEAELRELGEDIKKNGLRSRVTVIEVAKSPYKLLDKNVALLDGRNRLDAIELVGRPAPLSARGEEIFAVLSAKTDPYAYVISANIQRRHLTAEQKRELIAKLLKAKPEQSNRQVAKQVKADDKTVAKVRNEMEGRADIPNVDTRTDTKGRKQPAKRKSAADRAEKRCAAQWKKFTADEERKEAEAGKARREAKAAAQETFDSPQAHDDDTELTEQDRWQRSLANMAGEAVSLPAYWKKEFGDWRAFGFTDDLLVLARQAVDTWKEIAEHLASLKAEGADDTQEK